MIPKDIIQRLQKEYSTKNEYTKALAIITQVKGDSLNVGWEQLSRAMIILAAGDLSKLQHMLDTRYFNDPRDLIMQMMETKGNTNHYGTKAFEIEED